MRRVQLAALIAIPLLYYFALVAGAAAYPGYSHITRYASELGAAGAPWPGLFNYSIIAMGLAAMIGAFGLAAALRDLSGRWLWPALTGLSLALWGIAMVMGGAFPMPDERHGAFGLGLTAPFVSMFTLLSLGNVPASRGMRAFLALVVAGSAVMMAIMMGVGGLVTHGNVGIWQRINSGFAVPWLAVAGCWLLARGRAAAAVSAAPPAAAVP